MRNSTGFIIQLSEDRFQKFSQYIRGLGHVDVDFFSEPVSEFEVRENKNFVCLLVYEGNIVMLAEGTRSYSGGTDLRQIDINCKTIYAFDKSIDLKSFIKQVSKKVRRYVEKASKESKIIPPKTFKECIQVLSNFDPKVSEIIDRYQKKDVNRLLDKLSDIQLRDLAFQKGAISDALSFADIKRDDLESWEPPLDINKNDTVSYLSGLNCVRLRETEMIHQDLNNLPGFELIKKTSYEAVVFDNGRIKLTVLLTDKKPLEEDLGVDLIYYNEYFKSFVMVQYKAMEKTSDGSIYRLPNKQLEKEILAMDNILKKMKINDSKTINDFRFSYNPFFLKLCPRLDFNPDSKEMMQGMYFPLDYWKILEKDKSILGSRSGKGITYENAYKNFNNTEFKSLLVGGWIGTDTINSEYLQVAIKESLASGRRTMYATQDRIEDSEFLDE